MSAPPRLQVFVRNHAARKGVPIARSFERWVRTALTGSGRRRADVNIVLFANAEARALNRQYRGKNYATNVLSFPYEPAPGEKSALLGELVLCPGVIAREARQQRKPLRDHYAHLTVHGVLHLLGHDHETEREAAKMEAIERRVLAEFGISDPYAPQ